MTIHETRAAAIIAATQDYLDQTSATLPGFAQQVAEEYRRRVPAHARGIEFHAGGDPVAAIGANRQLVRRMLTGEVRLPAELEEAWVAALPERWRARLVAELAARYGLLAVPIPGEGPRHGDLARLFREAGEAGQICARMLADGDFGPEDAPLFGDAIREIDDVIAAAVALKAQIRARVFPRGEAA